jgi:hypothetical protein
MFRHLDIFRLEEKLSLQPRFFCHLVYSVALYTEVKLHP